MDTTKLEYEFFKLVERVNLLESQREYDKESLDMVVRKTSGARDPMPPTPPPAPKFWKRWTVKEPHIAEPGFWLQGELMEDKGQPVYCFTREMLEAMLLQYQYVTMTVNYREFLNSYLKSNGGV